MSDFGALLSAFFGIVVILWACVCAISLMLIPSTNYDGRWHPLPWYNWHRVCKGKAWVKWAHHNTTESHFIFATDEDVACEFLDAQCAIAPEDSILGTGRQKK